MRSHEFSLPQSTIAFSRALPAHICTLVTGGRPPAADWLQKARRGKLWAIDHGVDLCHAMKCVPDFLLGDADSASPAAWSWALAEGVPCERFEVKKDLTDTQLALAKIKEKAPDTFLLLTGAFGGRFDHAMSTLFSCAFSGIPMILADEQEACFFLHDGESLSFRAKQKPQAISLFALGSECRGLSIEGVEWPLENASLCPEKPYAVSNELAEGSSAFHVRLQAGTLAVYLYWQ